MILNKVLKRFKRGIKKDPVLDMFEKMNGELKGNKIVD
jgi:hypothetical protein